MSKQNGPFEAYTHMVGAWGDVVSSWSESMIGMASVGTEETESWFKPLWDYFEEWGKVYQSYTETMKGLPLPYAAMRDYADGAIRAIDYCATMYDVWARSVDKIGRKQLEIAQGLASGRKVETAEVFDVLRQSYVDASVSLAESLRGTAFEAGFKGIEEVNKAAKQFLDSFPEEEKQAKETFQIFANSFIKMTNSWSILMVEASRTFSDMLAEGEISGNPYKKVVNTYGEAAKELLGALRGPGSTLVPGYKDAVEDATEWAEKYFDMISSWYGVPLKLYQGIAKSSSETYRFVDETLGGGKVSSWEEFYSRWSEVYDEAAGKFMEATQFSTALPKFTDSLVEYGKSTGNLYRRLVTPRFATREEVDKVNSSIEKVSKMMERKKAEKKEESAGEE
jgi:hypothetical protein